MATNKNSAATLRFAALFILCFASYFVAYPRFSASFMRIAPSRRTYFVK
jgi:hypothetical protein